MKIIILVFALLQLAHQSSALTTFGINTRYCHKCEGNINTDPCSYFQQLNDTAFAGTEETRCERNTEECYTSVTNGVVRRGCVGDGYCNTHDCETCNFKFCNGDNKAEMFCIQCTSLPGHTYDENCEDNPDDVELKSCAHKRYQFEDIGCYSMYSNETREGVSKPKILRGCLGYILRYPRCYDDNDKTCFLCKENGCNTHDMNKSGKINPTAIIINLSVILLILKNLYP